MNKVNETIGLTCLGAGTFPLDNLQEKITGTYFFAKSCLQNVFKTQLKNKKCVTNNGFPKILLSFFGGRPTIQVRG